MAEIDRIERELQDVLEHKWSGMGLVPSEIRLLLDELSRLRGREEEYRKALETVISAWEATKSGETSVREIQRWLIEDMKPAIDAARALTPTKQKGKDPTPDIGDGEG